MVDNDVSLGAMPDVVIWEIYYHVLGNSFVDYRRLAAVSKRFHALASSPVVWENIDVGAVYYALWTREGYAEQLNGAARKRTRLLISDKYLRCMTKYFAQEMQFCRKLSVRMRLDPNQTQYDPLRLTSCTPNLTVLELELFDARRLPSLAVITSYNKLQTINIYANDMALSGVQLPLSTRNATFNSVAFRVYGQIPHNFACLTRLDVGYLTSVISAVDLNVDLSQLLDLCVYMAAPRDLFLTHAPKLQTLHLVFSGDVLDTHMLVPVCTTLQSLHINTCGGHSDVRVRLCDMDLFAELVDLDIKSASLHPVDLSQLALVPKLTNLALDYSARLFTIAEPSYIHFCQVMHPLSSLTIRASYPRPPEPNPAAMAALVGSVCCSRLTQLSLPIQVLYCLSVIPADIDIITATTTTSCQEISLHSDDDDDNDKNTTKIKVPLLDLFQRKPQSSYLVLGPWCHPPIKATLTSLCFVDQSSMRYGYGRGFLSAIVPCFLSGCENLRSLRIELVNGGHEFLHSLVVAPAAIRKSYPTGLRQITLLARNLPCDSAITQLIQHTHLFGMAEDVSIRISMNFPDECATPWLNTWLPVLLNVAPKLKSLRAIDSAAQITANLTPAQYNNIQYTFDPLK
jgi:hypothetical protein